METASGPRSQAERALAHREAVIGRELRPALARLAWPAVLATCAQATFAIVDSIWVGRGLGAVAFAAVSTSAFVLWSLEALIGAVSVGLSTLVARRVGRAEGSEAQSTIRQGLGLAGAAAVAVAGAGWWLAPTIFRFMAVEADVALAGTTYLRYLFVGSVSLFAYQACEAIFRGSGNTRTPLMLLLGAVLANAVLDPILIFGLGPVPRLGVAGAALATVLARGGAALLALRLLRSEGLLPAVRLSAWRPHGATWRRILAIGSPASLNGVFFCLVYVVLTRIAAPFGTESLAALGVGHKGEAPCYFVGLGFSLAVAPLVGQLLGAGEPERAERAAWLALRWAASWALIWTLVLALAPRLVASVFVSEPAVVDIAARYLFIMAFSQVLMVVELVLDGAFAGAGDTLPPLLVGLPLSAARVPLAWWLAHEGSLGTDGIWIAIALSSCVKGLLLAAWFRRGRWKTKLA